MYLRDPERSVGSIHIPGLEESMCLPISHMSSLESLEFKTEGTSVEYPSRGVDKNT